jgi:hypothetical protein
MKNTKTNFRHDHGKTNNCAGNGRPGMYHTPFEEQEPVIDARKFKILLGMLVNLCDSLDKILSQYASKNDWLPVAEVGRMFRISGKEIAKLYNSGEIPGRIIDGRMYIRPADIDQYLEDHLQWAKPGKGMGD